jgi:hypothetical protein
VNLSPSPPQAPAEPTTPARTDLAVHLTGWHVAETITLARSILMVFPSVRLSFTHPQPVRAALTAWSDAERLAAEALPRTCARPVSPESTVSARVCFGAPVSGVQVDALPTRTSPTGVAQVRVKLGALLIIAADRDAVACQLRLWQAAARHADELWPATPSPEPPSAASFAGLPPIPGTPERISA